MGWLAGWGNRLGDAGVTGGGVRRRRGDRDQQAAIGELGDIEAVDHHVAAAWGGGAIMHLAAVGEGGRGAEGGAAERPDINCPQEPAAWPTPTKGRPRAPCRTEQLRLSSNIDVCL